jgi:hypothetical protein
MKLPRGFVIFVYALAALAAFFIVLPGLGDEFRSHLKGSLALAILLLTAAVVCSQTDALAGWPENAVKVIRFFVCGLAVGLSVFFFADWHFVRDKVGYACVNGYSVSYYEDETDYGQRFTNADVRTPHWYSRVALWAFEWVYVLLCLAFPTFVILLFHSLELERRLPSD